MHRAQRVWVSGASGFLGRAVCDALIERGIETVPILRAPASASWLSTLARPLEWNLFEPLDLGQVRGREPSVVMHLAATRPASFSATEAERVAAQNLRIDRNLLGACSALGCGVISASGCSVYGSRGSDWLDEEACCSPMGPYPSEKLQAEDLGRELDQTGKIRFASLRISAPYGVGQVTRTVLQHFLALACAGTDLTYHGSGQREQDFIHRRDVAAAFVAAFDHEARGIYNIASGSPITMRELAELVIKVVPNTPSRVYASGQPDAQEDFKARYDVERAKDLLGFRPQISLDRGLAESVAAIPGQA